MKRVFAGLYFALVVCMGLILPACKGGSSNLVFELNEEGDAYIVTGMRDRSVEKVTIPEAYEGLAVKEISESAFLACLNLKKVTLPETLKVIGDYAFARCDVLKEVVLPPYLKTIGSYAFLRCGSLETISIPETVESIGTRAFSYCESLDSATFAAKEGWSVTDRGMRESLEKLSDAARAASYLRSTYCEYYWQHTAG